ncbi:MAG: hypothetical protein JXA90_06870, partial [Planctomycetes bacterium]|nr:hypothetical protein [Planctomycetota bacterium]
LLRWLIYIVVLSLLPGIDWSAHAGGFAAGALLGLTVRDYMTSRQAARWVWPAYGAGGAVALCLLFAVWNYFSHLL